MSQENVEVVRRAYELFNDAAARRGFSHLDLRWLEEMVAPEFEYVASGSVPGLAGDFRGVEGFRHFLESFWKDFDDARTTPQELIDAGAAALAVVNFHGRGSQSGAEVEMTVFQLWSFRDGKVVRGRGFFNREEALEAAGLSE